MHLWRALSEVDPDFAAEVWTVEVQKPWSSTRRGKSGKIRWEIPRATVSFCRRRLWTEMLFLVAFHHAERCVKLEDMVTWLFLHGLHSQRFRTEDRGLQVIPGTPPRASTVRDPDALEDVCWLSSWIDVVELRTSHPWVMWCCLIIFI